MDVKFMLSQFSYEHNGYWWNRNGPFVYLCFSFKIRIIRILDLKNIRAFTS